MQARELIHLPREYVWNSIQGKTDIEFEDGVTKSIGHKKLIFNRYVWELYFIYPETPITSEIEVGTILEGGLYTSDTHMKMLEKLFNYIVEHNGLVSYSQKEPLLKKIYQIVNDIYNEIIQRVSHSVMTMDAVDFVEVLKNPEIQEIKNNIQPKPEYIDNAYRLMKKKIKELPPTNKFVLAYRSKAINENQANQSIGPRGFVSDLDRHVFRYPVLTGYIEGLNTLYDIMVDSRTAAKSLSAQDNDIRTSEYSSRKIQLLNVCVENILPVDCGSTDYRPFFIESDKVLGLLEGTYYKENDDSPLRYIRGNETHLINTQIKIRTPFGCMIPNRHHICKTCAGEIFTNIKLESNMGYTTSSWLLSKASQSILSTKHLTSSVSETSVKLDGLAAKYFIVKNSHFYLNPSLDTSQLKIVLSTTTLPKLVDALNVTHTNIAVDKLGELEEIRFITTRNNKPFIDRVFVGYRDRSCNITKNLVDYIKRYGPERVERGDYIISLDKFNKNQPILVSPLKETNMVSFVRRITSIIETIDKDSPGYSKRTLGEDPYEKLLRLFNVVTEKITCPFSILGVIVYSTTAYNIEEGNFRLGRYSPFMRSASAEQLHTSRSASQFLVYQQQIGEIIGKPDVVFSSKFRQRHPLDVLFTPKEVIRDFEP